MASFSDAWHHFKHTEQLDDNQLDYFKQYASLLAQRAAQINLTTIIKEQDIINYHFKDSLAAGHFVSLMQYKVLADVGTGGGFPGIPLKIKYPQLPVYLLEVNQKKVNFLHEVITTLGLANVEVLSIDWRTFLRTTSYAVDLFCARASLAPAELLRMFQPASAYRHAQLLYWASTKWQPTAIEQPYITHQYRYHIAAKERVLVQFAIQPGHDPLGHKAASEVS